MVIYLDTETTGLDSWGWSEPDEVLSLGIIDDQANMLIDRLYKPVLPHNRTWEYAQPKKQRHTPCHPALRSPLRVVKMATTLLSTIAESYGVGVLMAMKRWGWEIRLTALLQP